MNLDELQSKTSRKRTGLRSFMRYWLKPGHSVQDKSRRNWMDLDNASTIFPSVLNTTDTKVFRFTATIIDNIDPILLQKALEQTYNHFPLYHSVIRRGFFWYYFEDSDLIPVVQKETTAPCMPLYHYDQRNLLFRVLYYQNRIHLEVFHALSDGTGAFWFLQLLVTNYIFLRYPESSARTRNLGELFSLPHYEPNEQIDDSFARYFSKNKRETPGVFPKRKNEPADYKPETKKTKNKNNKENKKIWKRIFQIRGRRTQDNRMQIFETEMPVKSVLKLAKERGVTLSVFLTALFIESIHRTIKSKRKNRSVTISVPINLRQFYPSNTARNFFATTLIGYQFGEAGQTDSFENICQVVADQYAEAVNLENIEKKLRSLIRLEKNVAIRPIFRPLKDLILKIANFFNNQGITAALSNMGKITFPEAVEDYVGQIFVYTAATRPQFAAITHKDYLTINFSSPYQNTDIQKNFVRRLTELKVPITVGANQVNPPEEDNEIL